MIDKGSLKNNDEDGMRKRGIKKSYGVLCEGNPVKYAWIEKHKHTFSISLMCKCLRVSGNGYYNWINNTTQERLK